jgi:hypothetical protein
MRRLDVAGGGVAVALLAGILLFWNLGGYALWDPDEGRHAEVARELFAATDWRGWIVPSLNFRPYYDKPILFYWLVGGAYGVFGVDELAARLVPAVAALGTVLAVYAWAASVWGVRAGLATGGVLVTAGEFVALGRYANLDMLLTLWLTLGLLAVHRWSVRAAADRPASLAPAAACAALGMLTKGLVAPVLIGGIGLAYLAVSGQLPLLRRARVVRCMGIFVAIAGPWYLAVAVLDPEYLREFFGRHHFQRYFQGARYLHPGPIYYYAPMLLLCFLPWSVLLPATVRELARGEHRGAAVRFCLCWVLGVLLFFSFSRGKLGTYILPSLPALALLVGRYVSGLIERTDLAVGERRLVGGGMLAIAGLCLAAAPVLVGLSTRIYGGAWVKTSVLAVAMIPLGLLLVALVRRGHHRRTPLALGAGVALGVLVFYTWGAPAISAVRSEAGLARAMTDGLEHGGPVPIVAFAVRTPSLLFYVQHPIQEVEHPHELRRVLAEHPLVFVVTSPKHVPAMLTAGELFPWHTEARHVLYASRRDTNGDGVGGTPGARRGDT